MICTVKMILPLSCLWCVCFFSSVSLGSVLILGNEHFHTVKIKMQTASSGLYFPLAGLLLSYTHNVFW